VISGKYVLVCGLLIWGCGGLDPALASELQVKPDAGSSTVKDAQEPNNWESPSQLLDRRRRGEQPCNWDSFDDSQVIRCEAAVDGAVNIVTKTTGRIYDSLKKSDPAARKVLDASTASWWKYFKQCDLFAVEHELIAKNGQLGHHSGAGKCRYGILADRVRELLEFEELVEHRRQRGSTKK
jgi:hypothetical protein